MNIIIRVLAVALCIALVVALELNDDKKKQNRRQREKIITLKIKLSDALQENERLSARLAALENHRNNMSDEKAREAAEAVRRYQRSEQLRQRIRTAFNESTTRKEG